MKLLLTAVTVVVAVSLIPDPAAADDHYYLTEEQLDRGCWLTRPNCLKASKPMHREGASEGDRYQRPNDFYSVRFKSRCRGPVFVKVLFQKSDGDMTQEVAWLDNREEITIQTHAYTTVYIEQRTENREQRTENTRKGESSHHGVTRQTHRAGLPETWRGVGVPENQSLFSRPIEDRRGYVASTFCETEQIEDLQYDF